MRAHRSLSPLQLTLGYAAVAGIWIVGFDWAAHSFGGGYHDAPLVETSQDLILVFATCLPLYRWACRLREATRTETVALAHARTRVDQSRRMYETLSAVNRRIIRPTDPKALSQAICDALLTPAGFCAAWVGRMNPARTEAILETCAGPGPAPRLSLADAKNPDVAALFDSVSRGKPTVHDREPTGDGPFAAIRSQAAAKSYAVLPFRPTEADARVLVVYSADSGVFTPEIVSLLDELAADLEFGLSAIADRERRTAVETALRSSEERYRLVTENSRDVIWMISSDGRLKYISPSIERLIGYTPAQMLKMDLSDYLAPESFQRAKVELEAGLHELASKGEMRPRLLEVEQVRADGTRVWTEANATGIRNASTGETSIIGATRDISERRAAEQALAREVARCRALLDVSVDGIHVTDCDGRLLEANEVFLAERGFTREQVPTLRVESWNAELSATQIRARKESIRSEPVRFETVHRRADGTLFPVEVCGKRVEVDGREMIYCTTRDISERKLLEQRLLRAQRLESVGLLSSGIAHDLNNVLTPILLSTGLLEMRYSDPEDLALLKPIEAAARRGSNIVQQILTFARGADGQRVTIEPRILVKELGTLIRETFPRNIVHRLNVAANVPPVIGDPTQLHQVFLNLAVNARDAMPQGGTLTIDISNRRIGEDDARLMPSSRPGEYVCVTVSDTGTGMTADVLDHIFEPFFTTKPRGRGTGLGLSTVHGLVRGHGGFVEVNSQVGRGSEFRVFLPAAPAGPAETGTAQQPQRQRLGHGEHILVADDEPAILTVLASVLQRQGFVTLTATDGQEALALLAQHRSRIAVVITDVMMPRFDGVRLATEVRARCPEVPIIAMSGMISPTSDDTSRDQLLKLGVLRVIDKPYGEHELLDAIEMALKHGAAGTPSVTAACPPIVAALGEGGRAEATL